MDSVNYDKMINHNVFVTQQGHLDISAQGHLLFAGQDTVAIAKRYGTPVFVFSEARLRTNFQRIRMALQERFTYSEVCFALKANSLLGILRILQEEGAFADVVSGMEFRKALRVGIPPTHIVFNGNNKSRGELRLAIEQRALINCDSLDELQMIIEEAMRMKCVARLCLRVNCDVDAGVIPEFATALRKSKFGLDLDGDAFTAFSRAIASPHCQVLGIHSHIGSQVEDSSCYQYTITRILDFCDNLKHELALTPSIINLGGGFAIPFEYLDYYDTIESFATQIATIFHEKLASYELGEPALWIEPGGAVIGTAAIALFSVGTIKERDNRALAAIDGGSDALLRATQGWYTYRVLCANKMASAAHHVYDIVGPLCYEGDVLARSRLLPKLENEDVLAFLDTGAYTTSLFNNYNGRLSPLVLMIGLDGVPRTIRARQSFEDLIRGEIF
jgi:diaminopimelate decarboxylase